MSEKPESDDFEEDEEESGTDDGLDLDRAMKDMDLAKKRGQKLGDPAWRRLEKLLEDKRTADLVSDFEDYDLAGVDSEGRKNRTKRP